MIEPTNFVLAFVCFCYTWNYLVETRIFFSVFLLLTKFLYERRWWSIFSKVPDWKPLFLLNIKTKQNAGCQISSIMQYSNTFVRISVKQNLDWQWLGKCWILGQIWAKRDKSWVCFKYRDLGGVKIPGNFPNFSPLLNLEKLFPVLQLTRNCYLKWTFFFSWKLII